MRQAARFVAFAALIVLATLIVGGCQRIVTKEVPVEVTREVEKVINQQVQVEVTRVVEKEVVKEVPKEPSGDIPFARDWVSSGHADTAAEAFVHWDEEDPAVVPKSCAKCHSTYGYQDFLGADGTAAGAVDNDAKLGSVITCVACHNEAAEALQSVKFPSEAVIEGLGPEARCMQCHQGRASTVQVDAAITRAEVADVDTVTDKLSFTNIHYFAAAATQAGGLAKGGYQYEGKAYDGRSAHVTGMDTCVDCHNPHTLELNLSACAECHTDVKSVDDVKAIRMAGSQADYDGDGDTEEGIYYELEGLQAMLYQAIQAYSSSVAGKPVVYAPASHPYFFFDTNGNGKGEADEINSQNGYKAWTPRLLKAAYNYQTSIKDPGAFAHGGKYIIQLLYDSIEDLNLALKEPVDLSKAVRIDPGHFAGSEEAFRHWDADGAVPGTCSKCHSADGLPLFAREGVAIAQQPANGFKCSTCHDSLTEYTRFTFQTVSFPSGAKIDSGEPNTNLCMNCHQGRESTTSVNARLNGLEPDTVSDKLRFQNVHYFAAGATLFGDQAKGAYQYDGKTYASRNAHVDGFNDCTECHSAHSLSVRAEGCKGCHTSVATPEDLRTIRMDKVDYDGDGDVSEGIAIEIQALHERLYAAIQDYATKVSGTGLIYEPHQHPYFFADRNGNRAVDPDEVDSKNAFAAWTPRLLKAAYNYQYVAKDPGAFAHNHTYILQILYDSLQDLGAQTQVDMTGLKRPE